MPNNYCYFFFHYVARVFGSIFFPLFSGYGENEFKPGQIKIVFARDHGFISLLNILRFFVSPVTLVLRESSGQSLIWKIVAAGGLKIVKLPDTCEAEEIHQRIETLNNAGQILIYLISPDNEGSDNELAQKFPAEKTLFFAVSGYSKGMSLGFIPAVRDMKAFCVSMPAYCCHADRCKGLKELEFLETALENTPQFELPSFFFRDQKFS